jgi:uncharacterized damage-inducible protein DinB
MMTKAELQYHLAFTRWASLRFLEAARGLTPEELTRDFGTAHRSVLETLAHIYYADLIWYSRINGTAEAAGARFGQPIGLDELEAAWPRVWDGFAEWLSTLEDPGRPLVYQDLKGNPYETPYWQVLMHVVNHGSFHCGQVAALFRQLGKQPPNTDLINYYRTTSMTPSRYSTA